MLNRFVAENRVAAGERATIGQLILSEDFSTSPAGFTSAAGVWAVSAGVLTSVSGLDNEWASRMYVTDSESFSDFDMTVSVQKANINQQIVFRSGVTPGSGYGVQLRGSDTFRIERWGAANLVEVTNKTFVENTWYSVRISCIGTNIKAKVWVRGQDQPSRWDVEVVNAQHASGKIGFSAEGATTEVSFDDLVIHTAATRYAA